MKNKITDQITFQNGATISNRIVMAPMQTSSGTENGIVSQDTIDYYQARNQAAGMIISEYHYVSDNGGPCSTLYSDQQQLAAKGEENLAGMTKLAKAMKSGGSKAILQIHHGGREANWRALQGLDVYAPSDIDFSFLPYKVKELVHEEILEIIADFGQAVHLAVQAGFDGVEIHGANHYLLQQFFSSYSNLRQDHWGGSFEYRMNFPLAVAEAVFDAVAKHAPADFIVGYRLSPEEVHGKTIGYSYMESLQFVERLVSQFKFDYIHLSLPRYDSNPGNTSSHLTLADHFAKVVKDPVKLIIVGTVLTEADAKEALKLADLVAVGKGILMDPEFGLKLVEGRSKEIVNKITLEQFEAVSLTPGLKRAFSDPNINFRFPDNYKIQTIFEKYDKGAIGQ